MTNRNKAKGTDWETEVVRYLNQLDLDARRTGSAEVGSGDVHFGHGWTVEAKNEAQIDLPGYLRQLAAEVARSGRSLAKAAVWVKHRRKSVGDAYVVMSGAAWRDLVAYVHLLEEGRGSEQTAA